MNDKTNLIQEGKYPLFQTKKFLINGILTETINARALHDFLGSGYQFTDWFKERIADYDFQRDEDYLLHKILKQVPHQGGLRKFELIEYYITLDMAKELSMVEKTEKGKQARKYFIEFEKKAKFLLNGLYLEHQRRMAKAEIELAIKRDYVTLSNFTTIHSLNYNRFLACISGKRSHALSEKCLSEKLGVDVQKLFNKANNKLVEGNLFSTGANNA